MTYEYETINGKTVKITKDDNGVEITREYVDANNAAIISSIVNTAQSAVGVGLGALTQAQVRSLMAILLYKAGGVNTTNGTVNPLNKWV